MHDIDCCCLHTTVLITHTMHHLCWTVTGHCKGAFKSSTMHWFASQGRCNDDTLAATTLGHAPGNKRPQHWPNHVDPERPAPYARDDRRAKRPCWVDSTRGVRNQEHMHSDQGISYRQWARCSVCSCVATVLQNDQHQGKRAHRLGCKPHMHLSEAF